MYLFMDNQNIMPNIRYVLLWYLFNSYPVLKIIFPAINCQPVTNCHRLTFTSNALFCLIEVYSLKLDIKSKLPFNLLSTNHFYKVSEQWEQVQWVLEGRLQMDSWICHWVNASWKQQKTSGSMTGMTRTLERHLLDTHRASVSGQRCILRMLMPF